MRETIKWLIIVVLVAGGVSITVAAIAYWPKNARFKYLTGAVTRGRVETVVNSTGKVKPVKSVAIGAFTSGPIDKVYVDYNSRVKKGLDKEDYPLVAATMAGFCAVPQAQGHFWSAALLFPDKTLLAEIDPRLTSTKVKQDRAFLETQIANEASVAAELNEAKNEARRAEELRKKKDPKYISGTDWDKAYFRHLRMKAQLKLAQAAIDQAQATLENSEANLAYTKIWSTENGIVIERKVDPGQTVAASFQTPELFVIAADMDKHMHIFGSVDEADIGLITKAYEKQNQSTNSAVSFTVDAYPGELFQGRIFQIRNNSTIEQNVVTYPVVIETTNPGQKLRPNMTATITFNIEAKGDVVRLPVAALRFIPTPIQVRPEDRHYLEISASTPSSKRSVTEKVDMAKHRQSRVVWVEDGEYLRAVPVTLGLIDRQYAELIGGDLTLGQNVVTNVDSTK